MDKYCECGCGQKVKNRFVSGHNQRGKKINHSEKTRLKIKSRTKERMNDVDIKTRAKKGLDRYWNSIASIERKIAFGAMGAKRGKFMKGKTNEELYGIDKK